MNSTTIESRLAELRKVMRREKIDAFIFPSTDPHNSEYVPNRWKGREFISGFNGSAGTAVVTAEAAALWTDSRYFIAAEEQLAGTEFRLMKERIEGTPSIAEWLGMKLAHISGAVVGLDGMVNSRAEVEAVEEGLKRQGGITLRTNFDPLAEIWTDRPALPDGQIEVHLTKYAGESAVSKIERLRKKLRDIHANGMLLCTLDDIAWLLNLRGSDVECNPVFVAWLLIEDRRITLFTKKNKLNADVMAYLEECGVAVAEYDNAKDALAKYGEYNILIDPYATCNTLYKAVRNAQIIRKESPVPLMKAVKNETEQQGFRNAMERDGVAMTRFLMWLEKEMAAGKVTELDASRKLRELRAQQENFRDVSFETIAAYGEHGAIVHYEPTPETDAVLKPEGLLLVDSGAQYLDGTTDITRTIALGQLTDEEKRIYTLVLKGHIDLQMCKFPDGASGTQIDMAARIHLWKEGLNYMHGTGHGVGAYLNVHEGPHQIRMEWRPTPLRAGMTVTDEPGLYLAGKFGVRIENTLLVNNYMETQFGKFLGFETLTLCPIDKTPIMTQLLTKEETEWLDAYHAEVYRRLEPRLNEEEKAWLREKTAAL